METWEQRLKTILDEAIELTAKLLVDGVADNKKLQKYSTMLNSLAYVKDVNNGPYSGGGASIYVND